MLCEARLIDGLSDAKAQALFDAARDADYEPIAGEGRTLAATSGSDAVFDNLYAYFRAKSGAGQEPDDEQDRES